MRFAIFKNHKIGMQSLIWHNWFKEIYSFACIPLRKDLVAIPCVPSHGTMKPLLRVLNSAEWLAYVKRSILADFIST